MYTYNQIKILNQHRLNRPKHSIASAQIFWSLCKYFFIIIETLFKSRIKVTESFSEKSYSPGLKIHFVNFYSIQNSFLCIKMGTPANASDYMFRYATYHLKCLSIPSAVLGTMDGHIYPYLLIFQDQSHTYSRYYLHFQDQATHRHWLDTNFSAIPGPINKLNDCYFPKF